MSKGVHKRVCAWMSEPSTCAQSGACQRARCGPERGMDWGISGEAAFAQLLLKRQEGAVAHNSWTGLLGV